MFRSLKFTGIMAPVARDGTGRAGGASARPALPQKRIDNPPMKLLRRAPENSPL